MPQPVDFQGRTAAAGTRRAVGVGLVAVAFIAIAMAKPWEAAGPSASQPPLASSPVAPATRGQSPRSPALPTPVVAASGSGFVVGRPPAGTWTSLAWTPVDPGIPFARVRSVVRWQHGYLAIGPDDPAGTLLWSSPDGAAWDAVPIATAGGLWPGTRIWAAVGFRGSLWTVGTVPMSSAPSGSSTPAPTYLLPWTTADGRSWQLTGATTMPTPLGLVGPVLATVSQDRLVLAWNELSPDGSMAARVWWSADGSSWHEVAQASLPAAFQISALVGSPGGFLIGGQSTREGVAAAAILRSPDGSSWVPVALPVDQLAAAGATGRVVLAIEPGANGVLAVGAADDLSGRNLWWRSPDGRTWSSVGSLWPLGRRPCAPGVLTPGGSAGCGIYPNGVVGSDGARIVALPADGSSVGWTSVDARTWTAVEAAPASMPAPIDSVVVMPGGVLVDAAGHPWYGTAS
jgi:hypothetical protein